MKYIVQLTTGGRYQQEYTASQIISRLREVMAIISVDKVLLGWFPDTTMYRAVGDFLHSHNISMILWLPVFSNTAEFGPVDVAVDLWGQPIDSHLIKSGESFDFCCPSSQSNIDLVKTMFQEHFSGCGFDGVFLDRIRTHSFGGGVSGVLSCGCARCREAYDEMGLSLDLVKAEYALRGDHFFDAASQGALVNPIANAFLRCKSQLIAKGVGHLAEHFKSMGLQVGLDLFAPLLSNFVGQDYKLLTVGADFIKPMLYRQTLAPAGMAYEYDLIRKCAPNALGYPEVQMDEAFLASQIRVLANLPCDVYPGIEINYNKELVPTSPQYVRDSVQTVRDQNCQGVALSWNIMQAPTEHLEALI